MVIGRRDPLDIELEAISRGHAVSACMGIVMAFVELGKKMQWTAEETLTEIQREGGRCWDQDTWPRIVQYVTNEIER